MKVHVSLCLVAFIALLGWSLEGKEAIHDAITFKEVTDGDVKEIFDTRSEKVYLVYAYSSGCGYCKQFTPVFEETSRNMVGKGVTFVKVNGPKNKQLAAKMNAKGWPSVALVRSGVSVPFSSDRTVERLTSFIEDMSRSAVVELSTDISSFPRDIPCIFFISSNSPGELELVALPSIQFARFYAADSVNKIRDAFKRTGIDLDLSEAKDLKEGVISLKERKIEVYSGPLSDLGEVKKWIERHRFMMLPVATALNFRELTREKLCVLLVYRSDLTDLAEKFDVFVDVAERVLETMPDFTLAKLDGLMYPGFLPQFGLDVDFLPQVIVLEQATRSYYFNPERQLETVEEVLAYLNDISEGNVERKGGNIIMKLRNVFLQMMENKLIFIAFPLVILVILGLMIVAGIVIYLSVPDQNNEEGSLEESDRKEDNDKGKGKVSDKKNQ